MAQIASLTSLYPFVLRWLPGCELQFILRALQDSVRYICSTYEVWKEDLDPQVIVSYQQDYALSVPSANPDNTPTSYSAAIHRICEVKVNNQVYEESMYDLITGNTLRFDPSSIPNNLDEMVLICGTAGSTTIADWRALASSSVGITLSSGTYAVELGSFAGLTFPQIALAIQTALRAEVDSNIGFCRWYADKFKLWVESGEISPLTAGSTGTDISGASWMNGLTAGTGVSNGGLLQVKVILRPDQTVDTLPDWLLDRICDAVIARSIWQLKRMPGPFRDDAGATIWDTEFKIQITKIVGDRIRAYKEEVKGLEG